jgi:hypothetical protein
MKECGTHYECCAAYLNALLYGCQGGEAMFDKLNRIGCELLMDAGSTMYDLDGDIKCVTEAEKLLTWESHTLKNNEKTLLKI